MITRAPRPAAAAIPGPVRQAGRPDADAPQEQRGKQPEQAQVDEQPGRQQVAGLGRVGCHDVDQHVAVDDDVVGVHEVGGNRRNQEQHDQHGFEQRPKGQQREQQDRRAHQDHRQREHVQQAPRRVGEGRCQVAEERLVGERRQEQGGGEQHLVRAPLRCEDRACRCIRAIPVSARRRAMRAGPAAGAEQQEQAQCAEPAQAQRPQVV